MVLLPWLQLNAYFVFWSRDESSADWIYKLLTKWDARGTSEQQRIKSVTKLKGKPSANHFHP